MPLPRSVLRMTDDELDEFLTRERTARLGTVSPDGEPHVSPLYFVWLDGAMWFTSLKRSRRMRDVAAGSRVAACVDAGDNYAELHGAVVYGVLEEASGDTSAVRRAIGRKYWGDIEIPEQKSHQLMVLRPDKIVSWDFKKIPAGRDRRLEAMKND